MRKLLQILRFCYHIDLVKYFYFNFISSIVKREKDCYILPNRGSRFEIDRTARIYLRGNLTLNDHKLKHSKAECYLRMMKNTELYINGDVKCAFLSTIELHSGSKVSIGKAYINVGAVIMSEKEIEIGNDVLISRNVYIYDSDFHQILDESGNITNQAKKITISNGAWLGVKSTILKGVKIGEGAILSANSTAMTRIKSHTIACGTPARPLMDVVDRK